MMKKVVYILFAVVGILAASCSKEYIQPTCQDNKTDAPQWKSSSVGGTVTTDEGDVQSDITDPNNDTDDKARRRFN